MLAAQLWMSVCLTGHNNVELFLPFWYPVNKPSTAVHQAEQQTQCPLMVFVAMHLGWLGWYARLMVGLAQQLTEGMAGASRASANTRLYVRPRVVLPKMETMAKAMRLPRPDLMKPPESQKAMAISHLQQCRAQGRDMCAWARLPCKDVPPALDHHVSSHVQRTHPKSTQDARTGRSNEFLFRQAWKFSYKKPKAFPSS